MEVDSIIKKAKKDKSVLAVMLYGSAARKEPARDIDICIVLHDGHTSKRLRFIPLDDRYDVHIFQELPLYIQQRILAEGKVLYCSNRDELYDVAFRTINDFEMFKPHYFSYLKKVAHG